MEPYAGDSDSARHHRKIWLRSDYLLDLRALFPRVAGEFRELLEVGCGMGHLHEHLGVATQKYVGVDMNVAFLQEGRNRYRNIRLLQGRADRLPLGNDRFDVVLCSDVLIHLEDMRPALREIIRTCRRTVLLRIRTGDGSVQKSKMIYDPTRQRLFSRLKLGGKWKYFYYNVLAEEDLRELLSEVGITHYSLFDLPKKDGEMGLTKVVFDVRQAKR